MQQILLRQLYSYMAINNPDLLIRLQEDGSVNIYLEEKLAGVMPLLGRLIADYTPVYIIEQECMDRMTDDLRPSRFLFIQSILEEEFEKKYEKIKESGLLLYEIVNMINECKPLFEAFQFREENDEDRQLRYAVTGTISEYLQRG